MSPARKPTCFSRWVVDIDILSENEANNNIERLNNKKGERLMILIISILAALGIGFLARYFYLDYKSKKEKSFLVVGLGLLAFWFFGGTGLLIIAGFLLCLFLLKGCV